MDTIPKTPLESLNTKPAVTAIIVLVHFFVKVFGLWKRPKENAAANFEEMSLMDKIYWAYKSKHLIKKPEKGISINNFNKGLTFTCNDIESKGKPITIGAVGDLIKNQLIQHSGETLYSAIGNYIFNKDISTANLESLLTMGELGAYEFSTKDTPSLHCNRQQFNVLTGNNGQKYSVLSITNNHSLDEAIPAFFHTAQKLKEDGIASVGDNHLPKEHGKCKVLERQGFKIGFISATYGLNGKALPEEYRYAVNTEPFHTKGKKNNEQKGSLKSQLQHAKEIACDFVIAHLHWGYEYELYPRNAQIKKAHELAETGVDLIVSHHPHVIQPYEIYTPKSAPHKRVLISYSLGNLTSNYSAPGLCLSTILNVGLVFGKVQEKEGLYISDAEFIPVVQTEVEKDGTKAIKIVKYVDLQSKNSEMEEILKKVFER